MTDYKQQAKDALDRLAIASLASRKDNTTLHQVQLAKKALRVECTVTEQMLQRRATV